MQPRPYMWPQHCQPVLAVMLTYLACCLLVDDTLPSRTSSFMFPVSAICAPVWAFSKDALAFCNRLALAVLLCRCAAHQHAAACG